MPAATVSQSRGRRKSNSQSGPRASPSGRGKVILQPITTPEPKQPLPTIPKGRGSTTPGKGRGGSTKVNNTPGPKR